MKIYLITLIILLLPFVLMLLSHGHGHLFFNRMIAFAVPYSIIAFPLIVYTVVSLAGRFIGIFSQAAAAVTENISIGLGVTVLLIMIVGHFWGPTHLKVKDVTVESNRIPAAFDGYKIVHLSDMHLASQAGHPEFVEKVVDAINEQKADMVCFTGDLVTRDRQELTGAAEGKVTDFAADDSKATDFTKILRRVRAKDGVYAVLGNHDYHAYTPLTAKEKKQWLEAFKGDIKGMGWRLLLNEHATVSRGADSICIGGCENYGNGKHFPQYGDIDKTFKGAEDADCKILLSHDPTHWERVVLPALTEKGCQPTDIRERKARDVLLTLSGHTHARQLKLLGWTPSRWIYKYHDGMYEEKAHFLNVSTGVGGAGLPFRLGAWPELCVITLTKK